jgi:hypothetical protein
MSHFVLLYHECPAGYARASHWDFMLEASNGLQTWAIAKLPAAWRDAQTHTERLHLVCAGTATGNEVEAEHLGDHRREYLHYEGPVSGGRGHVIRIDSGNYTLGSKSAACRKLTLAGRYLRGAVELRQVSPDSSMWILSCDAESTSR